MSKIEIKKTELVWRGKYDDEGKLVPVEKPGPFPFQIVESINEPRVEKGDEVPKQTTLFDTWKGDEGNTFEDGWKNKLIWGDNKFVMSSCSKNLPGKLTSSTLTRLLQLGRILPLMLKLEKTVKKFTRSIPLLKKKHTEILGEKA